MSSNNFFNVSNFNNSRHRFQHQRSLPVYRPGAQLSQPQVVGQFLSANVQTKELNEPRPYLYQSMDRGHSHGARVHYITSQDEMVFRNLDNYKVMSRGIEEERKIFTVSREDTNQFLTQHLDDQSNMNGMEIEHQTPGEHFNPLPTVRPVSVSRERNLLAERQRQRELYLQRMHHEAEEQKKKEIELVEHMKKMEQWQLSQKSEVKQTSRRKQMMTKVRSDEKLKIIMRVVEDKPFSCPLCHLRFQFMEPLRKHIKDGAHNLTSDGFNPMKPSGAKFALKISTVSTICDVTSSFTLVTNLMGVLFAKKDSIKIVPANSTWKTFMELELASHGKEPASNKS
eukprot:CAMPEP_0167744346 /NCGR_PEP_ID=MMETSP0110_2-20121227/2538_1 /TAXON_ID=629695 /ORGANISM="Gymnochlora sp., Strain CCMP2014" /LENGTH=339 /DNA_ID=CAMNT_0007628853 /DNA_START=161 /DNA_END=1181 /DNA_ORIENTATION=+